MFNDKGYTLYELCFTIVVGSVIFAITYVIVHFIIKFW